MAEGSLKRIADLLKENEQELLEDWVREQLAATTARPDLINEGDLREQSKRFLGLMAEAVQSGNLTDIQAGIWSGARDFLREISRSRAEQGFTPTETATFVLSLKQPLFAKLQREGGKDQGTLLDGVWALNVLLDKLGLYICEAYLEAREAIIFSQRQDILELSTPVIRLWDGILAVPLIGTLDSARTQTIMESLLQEIADTGFSIAIIDITGVPAVDTEVAQHLLKTVSAARLMGADCIVSGIRPQIAQTIVHLGVTLGDVPSKSTLADALAMALEKLGLTISAGS